MSARARPGTADWVESEAVVDTFVATAAIGADLLYAHADHLPAFAGAARVRALAAAGLVHPWWRRNGQRFDFMARLLARPEAPTVTRLRIDRAMQRMLDYIGEEAPAGCVMPSTAAIARACGLAGVGQAMNLLGRARRLGLLDWRTDGPAGREWRVRL